MTVFDTAAPWPTAAVAGRSRRPRERRRGGRFEAVLLASAAFEDGPTAALPLAGGTVLGRLLAQLDGLGAGVVHVVARPEMLEDVAGRHESAGTAQDLQGRSPASRAQATGPLALSPVAILVAHREALAGLLGDPSARHGRSWRPARRARPFGHPASASTGQAAWSAPGPRTTAVRRPTRALPRRAPGRRRRTGGRAGRRWPSELAVLVAAPTGGWRREAGDAQKTVAWRRWLARRPRMRRRRSRRTPMRRRWSASAPPRRAMSARCCSSGLVRSGVARWSATCGG